MSRERTDHLTKGEPIQGPSQEDPSDRMLKIEREDDVPLWTPGHLEYLRRIFPPAYPSMAASLDQAISLATAQAKRIGQLDIFAHIEQLILTQRNKA